MFALAKLLMTSIFVGAVCSLLAVGVIGIWIGIPLALLEILPGDDLGPLRQLPRDLLIAGLGGFAVGSLSGFASQLTGRRVNYIVSTLLVASAAICAISWTHPHLNMKINSTWGDYLNSYRLTALAALAGAATVVVMGLMLKPFQHKNENQSIEPCLPLTGRNIT